MGKLEGWNKGASERASERGRAGGREGATKELRGREGRRGKEKEEGSKVTGLRVRIQTGGWARP